MRSHSERSVFDPRHLDLWRRASRLVDRIGDDWSDELRCHELARAVCRALPVGGDRCFCFVRDGALNAIEHSWIELFLDGLGQPCVSILDVYAPGRMPQVQLVHDSHVIARGYKIGPTRSDVDHCIVRRLLREMTHSSGESPALE